MTEVKIYEHHLDMLNLIAKLIRQRGASTREEDMILVVLDHIEEKSGERMNTGHFHWFKEEDEDVKDKPSKIEQTQEEKRAQALAEFERMEKNSNQ